MTDYKAVSRLKLADNEYVERGQPVDVSNLDDDDVERLVVGKSIMEADAFDKAFPGINEGANQAHGTPSNLEQITGTTLQVNPPENDPEDEAPVLRDEFANPADVVPVEGAVDPGDGSDSHGQDYEPDEEDDSESETVTLDPSHEQSASYDEQQRLQREDQSASE